MKSEIILKNVFLDFPIYDTQSLSLRNEVSNIGKIIAKKKDGKKQIKMVRALRDINFNIYDGDRLALLGSNGSGKTTLLKLIAGIYSPSSGLVQSSGEISCMLDIGFGFEQDATGYENIILSNIAKGSTLKEINKILPEVTKFSGLGEFINMPFRTYSSGMQARLAFSSAIANNPGILLIDEFFSTGDIEFSKKSENKVLEMMNNSSILVFASHDLNLLNKVCNKAICMKNGEIVYSGNTEDTINYYRNLKK